MKLIRTPIATAVALTVLSVAAAHAQQAPKAEAQLNAVTVTGIRASLEQSLSRKRNADSNVEVITAEDIGKMPDKNVADSLQRIPGVNISSSAAGSGGFDENDRVSLRGTSPSLTQTLINGHAMSSGDWFVLDQVGGAVGRSASYSLLPSEIVGQVVVKKSPTADLVEGGAAGTVDIITRHPLDAKKQFSVDGSIENVYSTLANKNDPQASVLFNWKNDSNTLGIMAHVFSEKRSLRRDGQELLDWRQVASDNPVVALDPKLAGVWFPRLIGSSLFEQERKRQGGLIDVQFKPTSDLSLEATYFNSKMDASNYNRNFMAYMGGSGTLIGGKLPDSYTIQNGTLTSANYSNKGTAAAPLQYAIVDDIVREGAKSSTEFFDLDGKYRVSDVLTIKGKIGQTKGIGETPTQGVYEGDVFNTGLNYQLNGLGSPATVKFPSGNVANFAGTTLDWIFGYSPASTEDKEAYAQLDAAYAVNMGPLTEIKFGVRGTKHDRSNFAVAQGPNWGADPFAAGNAPAWNGQTYPSDFGTGLGGDFPRNVWQLDRSVLNAWGDKYSNRSTERTYYPDMFSLTEDTTAAYISGDLEGPGWSGNVGVRIVNTKGVTHNYQILPANATGKLPAFPWGGFVSQTDISNTYTNILPSANLKIDVNKDVVARFSVSSTMTRPDFGALAGTVSLTDPLTAGDKARGNGGNPYLQPILSNNYDATVQWYFAPRALASVGVFYMDLRNYVGYGKYNAQFINATKSEKSGTAVFDNYEITAPINVGASIKGAELALQMPVGMGFGVDGNLTIADGAQNFGTCAAVTNVTTSSPCDLLGASKYTSNFGVYFENESFNARVGYSWRSSYLAALDRGTPLYQDAVGSLAISLNYALTKDLTLSYSGQNLNNPILKNYVFNPDQPGRFYSNGAQHYVGMRFKF
ncbi:MAG: TonB-dependent receptor [Burkholderiales bacterium PBB3]|nr:MAG: TonB-dependent receptor [Burkholderiales bacterium PBB3]